MDGDRTRIERSTSGSVLTISEVLPVDVGSYTIFVQTRQGIAEHTILLCINSARTNPVCTFATVELSIILTFSSLFSILSSDRPERPASCPFVSQLTPSSLVLSWSGPGYDGGSPIADYVVEMQSFGPAESGDWTVLTSECKDTTYRVRSGLDAQGEYRFRVRACNAVGVSDPSEESNCIKMATAGTRRLRLYCRNVTDGRLCSVKYFTLHVFRRTEI